MTNDRFSQQYFCMHDLLESMKITHEEKAIIAPERVPLTCGQLCRQIEYAVAFFNHHGLGRNDRIAVVLPNGPEMAVTFLSVIAVAACAPLNPDYQKQEYDFYLSDINASALIVQAGMDSPARLVARSLNIPVIELKPLIEKEECSPWKMYSFRFASIITTDCRFKTGID